MGVGSILEESEVFDICVSRDVFKIIAVGARR